jgi:cytochrome c-type biogenesis protein CcsB
MIAKKIAQILFSTRLTALLFIVFAIAMAVGTFIEDAYNTTTARALIYNAWWFEAIMGFFLINFIGNIDRYRLFRKEKWATLLLHLSFILIILGAFITRYISYEGSMPIREGETENVIYSDNTFLTAYVDGEIDGEPKRRILPKKKLFLSTEANNHFTLSSDYNGTPIDIEYVDFIMSAKEAFEANENGDLYLKVVGTDENGRNEVYMKEGEIKHIGGGLFTFNNPMDGAINLMYEDGNYQIQSSFPGGFMRMADQSNGIVVADSLQTLELRSLYNVGGAQFVLPEMAGVGKIVLKQPDEIDENAPDALVVDVTSGNETKRVSLFGSQGTVRQDTKVEINGLDVYLHYGSVRYQLPFSVKLNDFIAEKYPGTEAGYSSYESQVTVIDPSETFDYRIYMNHVLDYKGYRFFQASFNPDEKGTILSVNHDFWGTWITYIGYFLLYFGLMAILFDKNTRFADLKKMLEKVKAKKASLSVLIVFMSLGAFAQEIPDSHRASAEKLDSLITANAVDPEHAYDFASLVIQDAGGRMKPVNTFASELLRKVSKSDTYKGLDANQVMMSIMENPFLWYNVPFVFLKRGNDSIRQIINVSKDAKYAAMVDFFDEEGNYKLASYLEEASRAAIPNQFQKDFLEVNKKVNLLYSALEGRIFRFFPVPGSENNKWISSFELGEYDITGMDSTYVKNVLPIYFNELQRGKKGGDYKSADEILASMHKYQKKYGAEVMPTDTHVKLEILYNKFDVFKKLFSYYMYAGTLMFIFLIIQIFKDRKWLRVTITSFKIVIAILFLLHTAGLIARWYISGHAPWSDAYESMIYVAWATMFFGLAFGRKSDLTLAATTFVASMILMIAHWNWMDPSIANLQPVLDSYWLMIHVAVIVASYGPFTLGMILGLVSLFLIIFTTKNNKAKMDVNLKELTLINEMALTVGLVMLTIGNFLGGQWANESWGRYWGWDPKETWALISIMIYAFVIHMRLVPGLRGRFAFNLAAVCAFASIMMTYFGVNFYLSGLHSYASGDKVVTPTFVYYSVAFVSVIGALAYWRYKLHYAKK